jgi:ketosteroid isomerase-like protein
MRKTRRLLIATGPFALAFAPLLAAASESPPAKPFEATVKMNATKLTEDHLRYLPIDLERWSNLIADDMIWEFPFAADQQSRRFEGRDAITKLVSGYLASVRDLKFTQPRIHRLALEDAVFAEFSGECTVIANGRPYSNDYAFYLRAANGRIALIREYINPLNSMKAFS